MPMLLIQGSFHLKDTQPDGDTVHFIADNPDDWQLVGGKNPVQLTAADHAKLRLEGIDALETHYAGTHQPLQHGHAAASELLDWLGFTNVQRKPDETVTASTPSSTPGFILTRGADLFGRVIALVGRGNPPGTSGTEISVGVPLLKQTANHHLVSEGLAFPTFYRSLFTDLRVELTTAAQQARAAGKGLWPDDVTTSGVKITGLSSITDDAVILPKLFRRLVDFLKLDMAVTCFPAFLAGKEDKVTVLSTGERFPGLHKVVTISNAKTVRLTNPAEDLLFDEG
ncbi:thermonuclease family protein [Streptomyces sp. NBC_00576]|uniref:thermonuclease family protein n=1 Tax=Streptomyces sp. NBC_00576 TaxID=2903665 RepID=UPI002E823F1D|nr:thermonuclease family protein [Streptomyces sp. NBC_00576]WUB73505.1 thermonuclease family protein [Streptomyces sp. NBC_00576]